MCDYWVIMAREMRVKVAVKRFCCVSNLISNLFLDFLLLLKPLKIRQKRQNLVDVLCQPCHYRVFKASSFGQLKCVLSLNYFRLFYNTSKSVKESSWLIYINFRLIFSTKTACFSWENQTKIYVNQSGWFILKDSR